MKVFHKSSYLSHKMEKTWSYSRTVTIVTNFMNILKFCQLGKLPTHAKSEITIFTYIVFLSLDIDSC